MQVYEIRILTDDLKTLTILEQIYINDHAAVRSARSIANDRPCEVWRDIDCIYAAKADVVRMPEKKPAA